MPIRASLSRKGNKSCGTIQRLPKPAYTVQRFGISLGQRSRFSMQLELNAKNDFLNFLPFLYCVLPKVLVDNYNCSPKAHAPLRTPIIAGARNLSV